MLIMQVNPDLEKLIYSFLAGPAKGGSCLE